MHIYKREIIKRFKYPAKLNERFYYMIKNKLVEENNIELDTVNEPLFGVDIDLRQYALEAFVKDGTPFYIVYFDEIKSENKDLELSYNDIETLCDRQFGVYNWGDADEWSVCEQCGRAIYLDDIYEHDYFYEEGYLICGDCIRNDPQGYFEFLENNVDDENRLVPNEDKFEELGYEIVLTFDYGNKPYGRNDKQRVLNDLLEQYPRGKFIFNDNGYNGLNVWGKIN